LLTAAAIAVASVVYVCDDNYTFDDFQTETGVKFVPWPFLASPAPR
jgi:hypothetical protein